MCSAARGEIEVPLFWPEAIARVRSDHREFKFLAEVYWDLEWTLQQQGFDYCYDKRLYDRLREAHATPVRDHLRAGLDYQSGLARFLENHDEPRAAATFPEDQLQAAAVITYSLPGMRFFQQGQFEGRRIQGSIHLSMHPAETPNANLASFYDKVMRFLPQGDWRLLECEPAWEGNPTYANFIASSWPDLLVVTNYAPDRGQCYIPLPAEGPLDLEDLLTGHKYGVRGHAST